MQHFGLIMLHVHVRVLLWALQWEFSKNPQRGGIHWFARCLSRWDGWLQCPQQLCSTVAPLEKGTCTLRWPHAGGCASKGINSGSRSATPCFPLHFHEQIKQLALPSASLMLAFSHLRVKILFGVLFQNRWGRQAVLLALPCVCYVLFSSSLEAWWPWWHLPRQQDGGITGTQALHAASRHPVLKNREQRFASSMLLSDAT